MDLIAPADSLLFWLAVIAFTFAISTGVLRRWVLGRPGVRRGVLFVGVFIAVALVAGLLPSAMYSAISGYGEDWVSPETAIWWSGALVLGLAGLVILGRATVGDPSRGRRRCGKCWYDMSATPGMQCPECGRTARTEKRLFRTRRRKRWFAYAALLLIGSLAAMVIPVWDDSEWEEWVPNSALVLMLPHMEERGELHEEFDMRFGSYADRDEPQVIAWRTGWRSRLIVSRCLRVIEQGSKPELMEAAVAALGNVGDTSSRAIEQLAAIATGPDSLRTERVGAWRAIVDSDRDRAQELLLTELDDTDPERRRLAVYFLAEISEQMDRTLEAPPRLLEIAESDPSPIARSVALGNLAYFARTDEAARILSSAAESPLDDVRRGASRALPRQITDPDQLHPILLRLARDPITDVRLQAVYLMAIHSPYTDEALDEFVRLADLPADELSGSAEYILIELAIAPVPIERRLAVLERTLGHASLRPAALSAISNLNHEARPLRPALERLREELLAQESQSYELTLLDTILWQLAPEEGEQDSNPDGE